MSRLPVLKEHTIAGFIYYIRGEKIMLDADLAKLYSVETRVLKQAVRRNLNRFPSDFMFELTDNEIEKLVSQNVIPSRSIFGGAKPYAFTEQGIAMLSGVLKSEVAVQVNIAILRTFVKLRQLIEGNKELATKIERLEQKYDEQFRIVFTAIQQMIKEDTKSRKRIGFKQSGK